MHLDANLRKVYRIIWLKLKIWQTVKMWKRQEHLAIMQEIRGSQPVTHAWLGRLVYDDWQRWHFEESTRCPCNKQLF